MPRPATALAVACLSVLAHGTVDARPAAIRTGTIIFDSSCDPFGINPAGDHVFAMRPDGSRLRTLTDTKGFVSSPDSVTAELTAAWDYASRIGR